MNSRSLWTVSSPLRSSFSRHNKHVGVRRPLKKKHALPHQHPPRRHGHFWHVNRPLATPYIYPLLQHREVPWLRAPRVVQLLLLPAELYTDHIPHGVHLVDRRTGRPSIHQRLPLPAGQAVLQQQQHSHGHHHHLPGRLHLAGDQILREPVPPVWGGIPHRSRPDYNHLAAWSSAISCRHIFKRITTSTTGSVLSSFIWFPAALWSSWTRCWYRRCVLRRRDAGNCWSRTGSRSVAAWRRVI